jgi:hypothetical protein
MLASEHITDQEADARADPKEVRLSNTFLLER